jgi:gliding motility-associated-like protein
MPYINSKKYFILFICILSINTAKAQLGKEAWHWDFGHNCSIDFSSGIPIVGSDSIDASEGCASMSDSYSGQKLFYTDGISVWDKNNHRMPNGYGLLSDFSSTQAALIVPKPGNSKIYYIITSPENGGIYNSLNLTGINYSVVDMSLNGGLGDISIKNQFLLPSPVSEKLVAVKHCNGKDYWIITHDLNNNTFHAFLLTSSGINPTPINSSVGTVEYEASIQSSDAIGYLKASPNGAKLALTISYDLPLLEIYDFDNATGQISNPISFYYNSLPGHGGGYGLEFSPDNSKLYVSFPTFSSTIYQYDITSNNFATINSSRVMLDSVIFPAQPLWALQLAPDGKIYAASPSHYLAVINNPNVSGLACNFQVNAVQFNLSTNCIWGLPNFIVANSPVIKPNFTDILKCHFFDPDTLDAGSGYSSYLWSNGALTQTISITNPGTYWVTLTNAKGCSITDTIHAILIQNIDNLKDTLVCTSSYSVNVTYPLAQSYIWNDGSTNPVKTFSSNGTYWVDYILTSGCVFRDSFNFTVGSIPIINLGRDTSTCTPSFVLSANQSNTYLWNTGDTGQQITISGPGQYWVTVTNQQGCKNSDSINVAFYTPPHIDILHDTIECGNTFLPININASQVNANAYLWSNGINSSSQIINNSGSYWVDYFLNHNCVSRDSFNLLLKPYPYINLGRDTSFCYASFELNAYNTGLSYLWNTGQTTPNILVTIPSIYWVKVTDQYNCINYDSLTVYPDTNLLKITMPNIVTPNDDGINDYIDFGKHQFSTMQLDIYNRWGKLIFESNNPSIIWKPTDGDGTYFYTLKFRIDCGVATENKILKGFIEVVR